MSEFTVPFAQRGNCYSEEEIQALAAMLRKPATDNKWQYIREFENTWCETFEAPYALAVSSGTAALHLALKAIDIQPGDEVIVTPWTWVASGNVILLEQATPVFVDVNDSLNIDSALIERAITDKTKAIIAVHFAGNPVELDKLKSICDKHSIFLIQDAAHAPGATYNGKSIERYGDLVCYSFYTQKNMSTLGEGGIVTCHTDEIYQRLKLYQNHGVQYLNHYQNPQTMMRPWLRECIVPGFNYRMSEAAALIGSFQLRKLREMNAHRAKLAYYYIDRLSQVEGIELPFEEYSGDCSWHFFVIKIKKEFGINRDEVLKELAAKGIQCNVHYTPLYHFRPFLIPEHLRPTQFPNAEKFYDQVLSLPLHVSMSEHEVDVVCDKIIEVKNDKNN